MKMERQSGGGGGNELEQYNINDTVLHTGNTIQLGRPHLFTPAKTQMKSTCSTKQIVWSLKRVTDRHIFWGFDLILKILE